MVGMNIGVLRGGPSREHDVSLKTGHAILKHLPKDKFTARDIYIDKTGQWHVGGKPASPAEALRSLDAVIVGLHGEYGEDGEVQKTLERFGVPFTGSRSFQSHHAMHKLMSKHTAKEKGVLVPDFRYIEEGNDIELAVAEIVRGFAQPVVVKPVRWGSSVGVTIAGGHAPIVKAVRELLHEGAQGVLVEELIRGREATAGVVEGLRDEELYALPIIEIVPPSGDFFSYGAKYSGETIENCPGNFTKEENAELSRLARLMHEALDLRHYSRSDFIVTPRGIYYLETNTLPGLTEESLLPKSLAAVGVTFPDFLEHLVDLAVGRTNIPRAL